MPDFDAGRLSSRLYEGCDQSQPTNAAWVLADSRTGLLRAQTAGQLFGGEHKTALVEIFSKEGPGGTINSSGFARGHVWKREVGLQKKKPLTGPLKDIDQHYVRLSDTM